MRVQVLPGTHGRVLLRTAFRSCRGSVTGLLVGPLFVEARVTAARHAITAACCRHTAADQSHRKRLVPAGRRRGSEGSAVVWDSRVRRQAQACGRSHGYLQLVWTGESGYCLAKSSLKVPAATHTYTFRK